MATKQVTRTTMFPTGPGRKYVIGPEPTNGLDNTNDVYDNDVAEAVLSFPGCTEVRCYQGANTYWSYKAEELTSKLDRRADEYVANGVEFLDAFFGSNGWRDDIDVTTLDVALGDHCPLGQLAKATGTGEGSYGDMLNRFRAVGIPVGDGIITDWSYEHGFSTSLDVVQGERVESDTMTQAWVRYLA